MEFIYVELQQQLNVHVRADFKNSVNFSFRIYSSKDMEQNDHIKS